MYVTINPHNMAEVQGITKTLRGASTKYVVDLIFDSIIYQWGLNISRSSEKATSHKIRLADRHSPYVSEYASKKHISITIAVNLILLDYFSSKADTKASDVAQITPSQTTIEPRHQTSPQTTERKAVRGAALLQNLKQ